jgi:predicted ester cyclase
MKTIILSAAISSICLLTAFQPVAAMNNATIHLSDTTKNQSALNKERNLAVYRGIESGDLSAMDKFVAVDIVDHGGMEDVKGLENVKKMLADIHNHFTNLKMTLINDATSSDGMYHYALVRMTGTTKDSTMGMPANTSMDHMSVDVVRLQNDKVAEHWSFEDARDMMKMMGQEHMDKTKMMPKTKKQ